MYKVLGDFRFKICNEYCVAKIAESAPSEAFTENKTFEDGGRGGGCRNAGSP